MDSLDDVDFWGSSPHTRGAPAVPVGGLGDGGIIPAYAGSTVVFSLDPHFRMDHPRIRGEHNVLSYCVRRCSGSSPHTRGARFAATHQL